jgi:hypothetical protein
VLEQHLGVEGLGLRKKQRVRAVVPVALVEGTSR